jgi:hypothetical protein
MFRGHLKLILRNFSRHRFHSAVNILGDEIQIIHRLLVGAAARTVDPGKAALR